MKSILFTKLGNKVIIIIMIIIIMTMIIIMMIIVIKIMIMTIVITVIITSFIERLYPSLKAPYNHIYIPIINKYLQIDNHILSYDT